MTHHEPPHQDLPCLQIQLISCLVLKELKQSAGSSFYSEVSNETVESQQIQKLETLINEISYVITVGSDISSFTLTHNIIAFGTWKTISEKKKKKMDRVSEMNGLSMYLQNLNSLRYLVIATKVTVRLETLCNFERCCKESCRLSEL